jgi:hypothetical protein
MSECYWSINSNQSISKLEQVPTGCPTFSFEHYEVQLINHYQHILKNSHPISHGVIKVVDDIRTATCKFRTKLQPIFEKNILL